MKEHKNPLRGQENKANNPFMLLKKKKKKKNSWINYKLVPQLIDILHNN